MSGPARDVMFTEPEGADRAAIDAAYRAKYSRYGGAYVDPMVKPAARAATLRLLAW